MPTPPTALYPLSLHDALPIFCGPASVQRDQPDMHQLARLLADGVDPDEFHRVRREKEFQKTALGPDKDRKSTRLNSSHLVSSYAVFCLKKKKYQVLDVCVKHS